MERKESKKSNSERKKTRNSTITGTKPETSTNNSKHKTTQKV